MLIDPESSKGDSATRSFNLWSTYGQGTVSRKLQKALTALIDDGVAAGYSGTRNTKADKQ